MQRLLNIATFLDPRYKQLPFLSSVEKLEVIDQVEEELLSMDIDTPSLSLEEPEPPVAKKPKSAVSELLGDLFGEPDDPQPHPCN